MTDAIHRVTEKLHKPKKNHNTQTNNDIYRLAKHSFQQGKFIISHFMNVQAYIIVLKAQVEIEIRAMM